MMCRYGHEHPPTAVQQSWNPVTGREGPLHCVECKYLKTPHLVATWCETYTSPEFIAVLVARERLCQWCFPERR